VTKIQINLDKDLDKSLSIFKVKRELKSKAEAVSVILSEVLNDEGC